jgi:hypothetical protein
MLLYICHILYYETNLDSEWQAILADEIETVLHDLMEKVDEEYNFMSVIRPRILFFPL